MSSPIQFGNQGGPYDWGLGVDARYGTGVLRENPQGGGVFFHHFQLRLAEKKTPPLSLHFSKIKKIGFSEKAKLGVGFFSAVFSLG